MAPQSLYLADLTESLKLLGVILNLTCDVNTKNRPFIASVLLFVHLFPQLLLDDEMAASWFGGKFEKS